MQQQRRRFRESLSLEEQFAEEAKLLREKAKLLPPGEVRSLHGVHPNQTFASSTNALTNC
jgi:hypothetical protein